MNINDLGEYLMAERFRKIQKTNRFLSLLLTEITIIMLATGYAMTFIGVDIPVFRIIHFLFDILFAPTFIAHLLINTFILRFRWKPVIISIWAGKADNITKLRVIQRLSSFGLLVAGGIQVISGLDWFKLGLSSLVPYPIHREMDLLLFIFLIIHISTAVYFYQLRRKVKQINQLSFVDHERREAIVVFGGAIIALFVACLLYTSPSPRDRS